MSPLSFLTSSRWSGMLLTKDLKYSLSIFFHALVIASFRRGTDVVWIRDNSCLMCAQAFSIGLRSGEFPGHSSTLIFVSSSHFLTRSEPWQGAPSCINAFGLMKVIEMVHVILQHIQIICSTHCLVFRKKNKSPAPFPKPSLKEGVWQLLRSI